MWRRSLGRGRTALSPVLPVAHCKSYRGHTLILVGCGTDPPSPCAPSPQMPLTPPAPSIARCSLGPRGCCSCHHPLSPPAGRRRPWCICLAAMRTPTGRTSCPRTCSSPSMTPSQVHNCLRLFWLTVRWGGGPGQQQLLLPSSCCSGSAVLRTGRSGRRTEGGAAQGGLAGHVSTASHVHQDHNVPGRGGRSIVYGCSCTRSCGLMASTPRADWCAFDGRHRS